jgi:hypothetical protein
MNSINKYINFVKLDHEKRIIVSVNSRYESYLHNEKTKLMIKKAAMDVLFEDFVKLEIGKNRCRITVKEGTETRNLAKIETELIKGLAFALRFVGV